MTKYTRREFFESIIPVSVGAVLLLDSKSNLSCVEDSARVEYLSGEAVAIVAPNDPTCYIHKNLEGDIVFHLDGYEFLENIDIQVGCTLETKEIEKMISINWFGWFE